MAHKNKKNLSPYTSRKQGNSLASRGVNGSSIQRSPTHPPGTRHRKPVEIPDRARIEDLLYNVFHNHSLTEVTHLQRAQLAHFCELLLQKQKQLNLTRLVQLKDIAIKHFLDCLIVPRIAHLQFPLLDMGSGPGFPGIPLKILFPEQRILLAEGVQKRVEFLKEVREKLQLPQLDIIGRNINEEFELPVQAVITRAVEDSLNTLRNVRRCLQVGGLVIQMKGPQVDPEIDLALRHMGELYELVQNTEYQLPQTPHRRRLVVFRKIQNDPHE